MAPDQRPRRSCNKQKEPQKQQQQETQLDYQKFRAIAGPVVHVAKNLSVACFFPQGFVEQASSPVSFSSIVTSKPCVLCRVLGVTFWGDPVTEEVFVKYRLMPLKDNDRMGIGNGDDGEGMGNGDDSEEGDNVVDSYVKCLTASDANNGGGFSVPRLCATSIFPPLNFEEDPPVQTLRITDVHGVEWAFRHIYRGTPRRHLLTSGWSDFVNAKVLTANDSVIFAKNKVTGELFVGIRRTFTPLSRLRAPDLPWAIAPKPPVTDGGFSRSQRGRVPAERVVEETEKAMKGMTFEVVYYPRAGLPEFVVEAHKVEQACRVNWTSGTRIKFPQNTEDGGPRATWFNGTVTSVVPGPSDGPWPCSMWRMLQVTWDEPEKLEEMRMLSPWQVECIAPTPPPPIPTIRAAFNNPVKRFKGVQNSALLADAKGDISFTQPGIGSLLMGQLSPSYMNYNNFPACMQGARQFPIICPSNSPTVMNDGSHQGRTDDNLDSSMLQNVEGVSTDLNIASSSCETPSPDSQNSVQFFDAKNTGHHSCNLTRNGITSFQLFGKIIHMEQPPANRNDISSTECDNAESQKSPVMKPSAF